MVSLSGTASFFSYYWGLLFGSSGWVGVLGSGLLVTIKLFLVSLPLGCLIGLFIALGRHSNNKILIFVGEAYSTIFRGLPEILTLFVVYYSLPFFIKFTLSSIGINYYVDVSSFFAGTIALVLVNSAYVSEVLLAALRVIPKGQSEVCYALGGGYFFKNFLVIIPQLWILSLPALGNTWLILLKDTSLVSVIALNDLVRQSKIAVSATKESFFFYLIVCIIYLILSGVIVAVISFMQRNRRLFE